MGFAAEKQWKTWVQELNREVKEDPISYLSVVDAVYISAGTTVYLEGTLRDPLSLKWLKSKPNRFLLQVKFRDGKAIVSQPNQNDFDLITQKRHPLGGGTILEGGKLLDGDLRLMVHHPQHPKLKNFLGFRFYPYNPDNPAMVRTGTFLRNKAIEQVKFSTQRRRVTPLFLLGRIQFEVDGKILFLNAYGGTEKPEDVEYLFVWFRDQSSGKGSYGGGRKMEVEGLKGLPKDGEKITLDFNRLTNPYCARTSFFNCLIPRDPTLEVAILAGEMKP